MQSRNYVDLYTMSVQLTYMTLVEGCTAEMLYKHLEELGVNIAGLRKTDPEMARLEAMYY